MNIPEHVVELAEPAVQEAMIKHGPDGHTDGSHEITRAALEAAAPHLMEAKGYTIVQRAHELSTNTGMTYEQAEAALIRMGDLWFQYWPPPRRDAALAAVEALHERSHPGGILGPYCTHCTSPIDGGPELWPCRTIRTIEKALVEP